MPFVELPGFMRELRGIDSIAARALEFTVLTGGRTSEVLKAAWEEIDTRATVWTIPAERMKANKLHRVPLSDRAMRILHSLPRDGSSLVFAGSRVGHSLSADSLLKLLQRLRPGLTVHGLRSSFRDWACDRTAYPRDVIEMALAHSIKDKSEAAY
jgi:integrase